MLSNPVSESIAIPVPVLLNATGINWEGKRFRQAGWGLDTTNNQPQRRLTATGGTFDKWPCEDSWSRDLHWGLFCISGGATVRSGDSGGPLYWTDDRGKTWVVGVAQGEPRYVPTFLRAGKVFRNTASGRSNDIPSSFKFLSWNINTSSCSLLKRTERVLTSRGFVRLVRWYSNERNDNYTSSKPTWQGCPGDTRTPGYGFTRVEGKIFHPSSPSPGTIPLYTWYSPSRGDNLTTTSQRERGLRGEGLSPDYEPPVLLGHIYPPSVVRRTA